MAKTKEKKGYSTRVDPECLMSECPRSRHSYGYCYMHWRRIKKHGDPNVVRADPAKRRRRIKLPDHPLADAAGIILIARFLLYEKLRGRGTRCHWCHRRIRWYSGADACNKPDSICADHLDGDSLNDDPANLVPACRGCNGNRARWGYGQG